MTELSLEKDLASALFELQRRVDVLEAQQAVRTLQHQYGYYLDKTLYREVVDLFAEDSEAVFCGGVFKGKASVHRLYIDRFSNRFAAGVNGPVFGFLLDHPQHQDVVTVSADGLSAKGRFRCTMQAGIHKDAAESFPGRVTHDQWWEGGMYENEYVKEDGVWKIKRLNYRPFWHSEYSTGWAQGDPMDVLPKATFPEDPVGPDEIISTGYELYPNTDVFPFHYDHPVTGAPWKA